MKLLVHSGCPKDFGVSDTITQLIQNRVPIFGVCLGLQGIVEHFGGSLDVLDPPMHGQQSEAKIITRNGRWKMYEGIQDDSILVAR